MIASFRNRSRFTTLFLALVAVVGVAGLTDAQQVTRRFTKKLDLASAQSIEKMHSRISLELTNATFTELLGAVSNKIGTPVTQSPEIATNAIQNARFTLKAENVPAHAVLMEALGAFELAAVPGENGLTISDGAVERVFVHRTPDGHDAATADIMVLKGEPGAPKRVIKVMEGEAHEIGAPEGGEKSERILVSRLSKDGTASFDENGKMRREIKIDIHENGVKSEGLLTMEISK